ncbi:MAG TPA: hypothetical protein VFT87_03820 [Candidatus Saccharimonadales bacterium]|nr:hypothetical protein [Candidatus Saccharimonadales bacterium]
MLIVLQHDKYKNTPGGRDGAGTYTHTETLAKQDVVLNEAGDATVTCAMCQAELTIHRFTTEEYTAKRRTHKGDGAKILAVGLCVAPLAVLLLWVSMSISGWLAVVLFMLGGACGLVAGVGAIIGGLTVIFGKPKRFVISEISPPKRSLLVDGWKITHSIAGN